MLRLGMTFNITLPLGGKSADYTRRNNGGVYDLHRHSSNNANDEIFTDVAAFFCTLLQNRPKDAYYF